MRIEIKRDLCIGAGTCIAVAPDVFELDGEMKAVIKDAAAAKRASDETLIESAESCPTIAIYLYDDDGKQIFPAPTV